MTLAIYRIFFLIGYLALTQSAKCLTVTMNTDAARAVLRALQDTDLSHAESLRIAGLQGNQGIIRKLNEFKIPATTQSFADALYACAHNTKVTDPVQQSFYFDSLKPKIRESLSLLTQIETSPREFQNSIEHRIALFTPTDADIHLLGYVVAGGDGGGYAFGETDFYLNIAFGGEFVVAKGTTTHELYHAVQGAFARVHDEPDKEAQNKFSSSQKACLNEAHLIRKLYEEGSATYVEDISLLSAAQTEDGKRMKRDMEDGLRHVHTSISLLEMSVISLTSAVPVSYSDVYDVDFLGNGVLYNIGYVMAKAIVESDGPQGLAVYLTQPAYRFILRYTQLPRYARDRDHPALGPNSLAAIDRIATDCR